MAAKKTTCPITREQFKEQAKAMDVVINGMNMIAEAKEFSTGSLGWGINSKITLKVGEMPVTVQIGLNLTVVGSTDLPGGPANSE